MDRKVLIISDNLEIFERVQEILNTKFPQYLQCISFAKSPGTAGLDLVEVDIKREWEHVVKHFDLVVSLHCKQIFPPDLVRAVVCVNLHPGYNPYNQGMYPHAFSIMNGLPAGATLHVIDEKIDHGDIIDQLPLKIYLHETSEDVYRRLQELELRLFEKNFESLILGSYVSLPAANEKANLNRKSDFDRLKNFDLEEVGTFLQFYNRLRALSHGSYKNAYVLDEQGRKIFIKLQLDLEK